MSDCLRMQGGRGSGSEGGPLFLQRLRRCKLSSASSMPLLLAPELERSRWVEEQFILASYCGSVANRQNSYWKTCIEARKIILPRSCIWRPESSGIIIHQPPSPRNHSPSTDNPDHSGERKRVVERDTYRGWPRTEASTASSTSPVISDLDAPLWAKITAASPSPGPPGGRWISRGVDMAWEEAGD
jgi:hypothetical protein